MTSKTIRVGIIGTGGWAQYGHIPALQSSKGFQIVALASRRKEVVQEYADKFNINYVFGEADELINHPEVDLVVVLAPRSLSDLGNRSEKLAERGQILPLLQCQ